MDAFASPSIRAAPPVRGWLGMAAGGVLTLALGLSLMSIPGPPGTSLDGSWQEMLVHANAAGLQFGKDVIFTWGPWGFLCTRYHMGSQGAVPILIWETAGQVLVAACLVNLTWKLPAWRRAAFFIGVVVFHWLFQDTVTFVLIALAGIGPLSRSDTGAVRLILWAVLLGFLAQLKFTYFVISAAAILASAACHAGRSSWGRATATVAGYGLSLLASWAAAGQGLDNLYPYVRRSLEISSGYGDAMGLDESWTTFGFGAAIAVSCGAFCGHVWRSVSDKGLARASSVLLGFIFFVMWKEAFTRADFVVLGGHIFGFFGLVAILAPAAAGVLLGATRPRWYDAPVVLCLVGVAFIDPAYYSQVLRIEWQRLYGNVRVLERLGHQPSDWEDQLSAAKEQAALPRIKAAVATGTIDSYNYQEGVPLLNGLALSARPIFQSYSAYTPSLEGWNLRYFLSDKAPDFLLWNDGLVDNRYPGEDDAMLVEALPGRYEPVLSEDGFWLFKKRASPAAARPAHRLLLKTSLRLGEPLEIPPGQRQALWLEVDPIPNALGRARALLYKPAQIQIVTTDDKGQERSWRLLPRVAAAGFLLVPTLEHGEDLAALMQGETNSWIRKIRFAAPGDQDEFWARVDVNILSIPSLPLAPLPPSQLIKLGIIDRRPASMDSVADLAVVEIPEGKALQLHAPGSMVFDVPLDAGRFSGTFGLRAGAYTEGGHTAGVEFSVEAVWPSGRTQTIWSRYLDPVANDGDRGSQHFDLELPPGGPSQIVLRTGTGPRTDNRWDWSYVTDLRFLEEPSK